MNCRLTDGVFCVGHCLCSRRRRRFCFDRCRGMGGGEAVIVFDIVATVLAVAAVGYLVLALVKPERF